MRENFVTLFNMSLILVENPLTDLLKFSMQLENKPKM